MKRNTNIKQHYIPQFYLRHFSNDKGQLFVYDIHRTKKYISSPLNECNKKFFYDIKLNISRILIKQHTVYDEIVDDKIRILNEDTSAILLHYLKTLKDVELNFKWEQQDRNILYNFIILQMVRTPFYRERLRYLSLPFCLKMGFNSEDIDEENILAEIHNLLLYGILDRLYSLRIPFEDKFYQFFNHLIDDILNIKRQLELAGKLFLVNRSKTEFICSDSINFSCKRNPFAQIKALLTPLNCDLNTFDVGDPIELDTVFFPISKDVAIFIFNKEYHNSLLAMSQGIGIIRDYNSDIITNLNLSTFLKCKDKIYSSQGNYGDILKMKDNKQSPLLYFRFDKEIEFR
jgi:hypothetical protein